MKIKSSLMILVILLTISISIVGCSRNKDVETVKQELSQVMQDVYAPKTMEQFIQSHKKYNGTLFTKQVADKLYTVKNDKLSERDLGRSCIANISYSNKEDNSSNIEMYLAELRLYDKVNEEPIIADIIFHMGEDGLIYEYYVYVK